MILSGDLKKIQDSINKVIVPLTARVEALEAEVKALKAPKASPKATPKASS